MKLRVTLASALLLLAAALPVRPASTTVSGTVTDAQGNNLTGTATISWPSFIEPGGELVLAGRLTSTITNGALSVVLAPNAGSTPSGTSYAVRIRATGGTFEGQETWIVPNTGTANIAAVRTSTVPTPSAFLNLSALSTAGVSVGDIITAQAGPTWARLAIGAEGRVLKVVSGVPAWALESGGGSAFDCSAPPELTISSGSVTITDPGCYAVDTEGNASLDSLEDIACSTGTLFILRAANGGRTVRIVDDNAAIDAQADFDLDDLADTYYGLCTSTNQTVEVSRANGR